LDSSSIAINQGLSQLPKVVFERLRGLIFGRNREIKKNLVLAEALLLEDQRVCQFAGRVIMPRPSQRARPGKRHLAH
jgi:hypothetical protein